MVKWNEPKVKKSKKKWVILGITAVFLLMSVIVILSVFKVTEVEITGNQQYTNEKIKELVMNDKYSNNTLYLYWKYHYAQAEPIPFIDKLEVDMANANKVRFTVYEKKIVGYIEYLGTNMYFDKEGTVVESSAQLIQGIPLITGLSFNQIVLHEKIPVKHASVFKLILNLTQLLQKSGMAPDRIYISPDSYITLYFENAKVYLGKDESLDEKIVSLQSILPSLKGLSGTLHMENYNEDTKNITFIKD